MSVASQSPRPVNDGPLVDAQFDLPALGAALWRKKWKILRPTILAALVTFGIVQLITPKYLSESRVLIEARDNIFLRPDADKDIIDRGTVDQEAVASQAQLILSRDLAGEVIAKLKLNENPEFDPALKGISPIKTVLGMIGITKNPASMTPQERVLESYYDRLTVYPVEKSRVIVIDFLSEDSIGPPECSISRMSLALASASAFCARAAASCVLTSPSCWAESVVLLGPTSRLDLARKASTLASASATFLRIPSISPASHWLALRA